MDTKDDLNKLIMEDVCEERERKKEYGDLPFKILHFMLFGAAIFVMGISLLTSITCFIAEIIIKLAKFPNIIGIENIIACFQPCITSFAIGQFFIVSALTLSELRTFWLNKRVEEMANTSSIIDIPNKNSKTDLLMDFVLSSILMAFVILLNNIINLNLDLGQVINVALFLGCLMIYIILLKELIVPFFYRLQTRKKVKKTSSTIQGQ